MAGPVWRSPVVGLYRRHARKEMLSNGFFWTWRQPMVVLTGGHEGFWTYRKLQPVTYGC